MNLSLKQKLIAALAALSMFGCGGPLDSTLPDGGSMPVTKEDVIARAKALPEPIHLDETPVGSASEVIDTYADGKEWKCKVQKYTFADDPEGYVTLNPGSAVIWPGSLVQGGTLESGSPEPIAVKRGGGTVLMNLLNSGSNTVAKTYQVHLAELTQGNVVDAQNAILSNNVGKTPAAFSFDSVRIDSEEELAAALKIKVKWLSGSASASLKFSSDKRYTRYLVKLTQQYYTMVYQTPTSTSDLFDPSVTTLDLAKYVGPGNPAGYISSVTYGRQFYLLFESTSSSQELQAALSASYSGLVVSGSAELTSSFKHTSSQTSVKVFAVGGAATTALDAALGAGEGKFEALHNFIVQGGDFDANNPGLPLSYVVRYVADNKVMRVNLAGDYSKKTCTPVVKNDGSLVMWLDATNVQATDNQTVASWKGKTMASNDGVGHATFSATGINNHPAMWFYDTVNQGRDFFSVDLGTLANRSYTMVTVTRTAGALPQPVQGGYNIFVSGSDDWARSNLHAGWHSDGNLFMDHYYERLDPGARPSSTGDVTTLQFSTDEGMKIFNNGLLRGADKTKTDGLTSYRNARLGSGRFSWFTGYIGEARAYNYALSDAERRVVECELSKKFDIGVADCVDGQPDPSKVTY